MTSGPLTDRPAPEPRRVGRPGSFGPEPDPGSVPRTGCPRARAPSTPGPVDPAEARDFLELFYAETSPSVPLWRRWRAVRNQLECTGSYVHTSEELRFGAQLAWRGAARCIGRLYWRSLYVRDLRHLRAPADLARECAEHLRCTVRDGRIRSTISVFAPDLPGRPGPRVRNEQLVRYAGYRTPTGEVLGDGGQVRFTAAAIAAGWSPPEPRGRFDVLPLLICDGDDTELHELPPGAVLEVPLTHPDLSWFADLGLRWHAIPAISNMPLRVGGITYPAAPFNGWYLDTEVGARNLADQDRYDLLPVIAGRMGLDTRSARSLWQDRAVLELVTAVLHSFDRAGVTMADHHTESARFLQHLAREEASGRRCPADWSWIVPPMSGGLTPVFHRYYDAAETDPPAAFLTGRNGS